MKESHFINFAARALIKKPFLICAIARVNGHLDFRRNVIFFLTIVFPHAIRINTLTLNECSLCQPDERRHSACDRLTPIGIKLFGVGHRASIATADMLNTNAI